MSKEIIEKSFPSITTAGYSITSPRDEDYNCIAWALGMKDKWIDPTKAKGSYWPEQVPRSLSISAFVQLYEIMGGFTTCSSSALEEDFEKIALYFDENSEFCHVSRQTCDGRWASKLGNWEDIEHNTLEALEGEHYGTVVHFMKRARVPSPVQELEAPTSVH